MQTPTLAEARFRSETSLTLVPRPSPLLLLAMAAAFLLSPADRGLRAQQPSATPEEDDAGTRAQAYFENDKPRRATAILAQAAREHPEDRVIGAMLYASIRDHVWHLPQILPVKHSGEVRALAFREDGKVFASGSTTGEVWISPTEPKADAGCGGGTDRPAESRERDSGAGFFEGWRPPGCGLEGGRIARLGCGREDDRLRGSPAGATRHCRCRCLSARSGGLRNRGRKNRRRRYGRGKNRARSSINPAEPIRALAFSRNAQKLAAACHGGLTRVWDLETGKPLGDGIRQEGSVLTVDFGWDDSFLVTARRR